MKTSLQNAKSVGNLTFQGVLASSLKSPVCEAACGVVTTTKQLRGCTVIRLCKDLSPRKGPKPTLGQMTSLHLQC